jgi:hypothetical protein
VKKLLAIVLRYWMGNRAATCFKLDRRIAMMLELQVSSKMLLVQQQPCSSSVTSNC